jgi:hypothetical protein
MDMNHLITAGVEQEISRKTEKPQKNANRKELKRREGWQSPHTKSVEPHFSRLVGIPSIREDGD